MTLDASGAEPVFEDGFSCQGRFEIETIFDSVPERRQSWAIKMTEAPDGRLLIAWGSTSGKEASQTNKIWIAFSSDEGVTWSKARLFAEMNEEGWPGHPCLYTHTDGRIFLFYNRWCRAAPERWRYKVYCQTSANSGETWSKPERIGADWEDMVLTTAIRLRNGTILLPVYCDGQGAVMLSNDNGQTWRRRGSFEALEPAIAELRNGDLYCLVRTREKGYQYQCWSHDVGLTWTKPEPSPFESPSAVGILWRLASGNLVFVWNKQHTTLAVPRYPLCVAMSEDDGKTWPYQKMIETTYGEKQLSNHGVYQTGSGIILMATNHHQGTWDGSEHGRIELARFDEAWIRSRLSPDKWEERPSATGGIRLDTQGVLLASGAHAGDQTLLVSKFALPRRCVVEYDVTDEVRDPETYSGLFLGSPPWEGEPWLYVARVDGKTPMVELSSSSANIPAKELSRSGYYRATKVRLQLRDGRVCYEDSTGAKSDWLDLPPDLQWPARWGFFTRNAAGKLQGKMRITRVRVTCAGPC